jgi:hypothetical protein
MILVAYILGSVATFFLCRKHWIQVGSTLTFDLFVKYGYVRHKQNENGEIELIKLTPQDYTD